MKVPISISMDKSTADRVEKARGLVPRSRVFEMAINYGIPHLEEKGILKPEEKRENQICE